MNQRMIDHPAHYNVEGKKECIVEMEEKFGPLLVKVFDLMNAYKYLYRAGYKWSKDEDLQKANWYVVHAGTLPTVQDLVEKYQLNDSVRCDMLTLSNYVTYNLLNQITTKGDCNGEIQNADE